jgi:predicted RNA-binding Zn-ribbon protein involved in translation (DUF1610 family)/transposase-like protein
MTIIEWQRKFSDDDACRTYLFAQRWPNGFVCPKCQGTKYWTVQRSGRHAPVYECAACGHQASVTAGTVFARTKVALQVWFWAIFFMAVDKGGKSAMALSRELGLPYMTAWLLHHKIQQAMADRNRRYKLGGLLELDDAYFGGVSHGPGKRGRGTDQDPVLVGVSLTEQGHPQHAFLEVVPDLKAETVKPVLERRVENQGIWRTDGAEIYARAAEDHQAEHKITLSTDPQADVVFHWINIVISNAKTYIDGTYHGRGRARRQLYLEEFTYRFNRRYLGTRIADRLVLACLTSQPHPYGT